MFPRVNYDTRNTYIDKKEIHGNQSQLKEKKLFNSVISCVINFWNRFLLFSWLFLQKSYTDWHEKQ